MYIPAHPSNEAARIALLRSLDILDTAPDERFDRLTRLAKRVFDVPIATVSLVDSDRQWFKSCVGLSVDETARNISFCGHTILDGDLLVVEDAQTDPRFADSPLVTGDPGVRFYAGCPLTLNKAMRVGAFCIVDKKPRKLDAQERGLLRDLARIAERELEVLQLVATDDLTGLSNRRGFEALGNHVLALCKRARSRASVLFFDLNGFKQINDMYGHAEGDRAIVGFASVLRTALRETDVLARLGGDEFVALVAGAQDGDEARIIERVRLGVAGYNRANQRGYDLKFSVGFAPFETNEQASIAELIDIADHAMYANKRAVRERGARAASGEFAMAQ
ncbi:sensor domain-containing diguanylate cyclase [Trinickia diaoshuihuensis]|uniref:sensor domain-containing diguanylate cyclase n=1 Tax=Trinickia diaoshuihuensis TaxID=2292265 RepID=UPI000E24A8DB|nr:sensor domain-containing diguanylate cyclase [Trinickia diaoshuihuensis]